MRPSGPTTTLPTCIPAAATPFRARVRSACLNGAGLLLMPLILGVESRFVSSQIWWEAPIFVENYGFNPYFSLLAGRLPPNLGGSKRRGKENKLSVPGIPRPESLSRASALDKLSVPSGTLKMQSLACIFSPPVSGPGLSVRGTFPSS